LRNCRTRWMATAVLTVAGVVAPCLAQNNNARHNNFRPLQGHPPAQTHPPGQGQGHSGDWLRPYKGLSPSEQQRALQNDPGFRRLSPERQQMLQQRLQHFSSLPPQEQQRMLRRMETWEHLTPGQKQAVRDLRSMPPQQREQIIDSNRFRGMFSPQERDIMRGATRLPLAPPENSRPEQ
jgi:hypothetical protein